MDITTASIRQGIERLQLQSRYGADLDSSIRQGIERRGPWPGLAGLAGQVSAKELRDLLKYPSLPSLATSIRQGIESQL